MILRQGRKVGRTIYRQHGDQPADTDTLIGVMDTPDLAELVVQAVNAMYAPKPHTYVPVPLDWHWAVYCDPEKGLRLPCVHEQPSPMGGTDYCRRYDNDPIHATEPQP